MDIKLTAAVANPDLNVAAFCRAQGIGRTAFYKWRARYRAGGLAGLEERSRRPKGSMPRLGPAVEDEIVRLRKQLGEDGLDNGAATIGWHLERAGIDPVPSAATVWRALRRRGLVVDQPRKRPRSSWRRFQFDRPNECWQIDATDWTMPSGTIVQIIDLIDDRSRVALGSVAVPSATTRAAWDVFVAAAARWGTPGMVLSDNGLAFSGRRRNLTVAFETNLRRLGVRPVCSSPYHPQTCGKVERVPPDPQEVVGRPRTGPNPRRAQRPDRLVLRLLQPPATPPGARQSHPRRGPRTDHPRRSRRASPRGPDPDHDRPSHRRGQRLVPALADPPRAPPRRPARHRDHRR